MLEVKELNAWYGKSHILRGVNFSVGQGEIVSLLGRNGVGRSTTVKAIMGEVEPSGSILFKGQQIVGKKSYEIAKLGIGCVPENRNIFPGLTVRQNLVLGMKGSKVSSRWSIEEMFRMFPNLGERADVPGGVLSGGEQQMLAMGRALISRPKILIVDELSLGLMPKVVDECYEVLNKLKSESIGILLVEQNTERAFSVADDISALEAGNLFWSGTAEQARANIFLKEQLMGVT